MKITTKYALLSMCWGWFFLSVYLLVDYIKLKPPHPFLTIEWSLVSLFLICWGIKYYYK